ncbi:hypothetical protein GCM10009764_74310 [Nocardia ninae]|uniref:Uncharacterized protein n=1 Tax=Nocardia ninae NBRC 108245 TaxID=1210091 RepID=A0A511MLY4_9NOCA|nr:hypothetical protein NN4_56660 [Nocardia ninae NBRC 108245]
MRASRHSRPESSEARPFRQIHELVAEPTSPPGRFQIQLLQVVVAEHQQPSTCSSPAATHVSRCGTTTFGLTALRRANGVPLDEAFEEAESAWRALVSKNGSTSMGRGELLAFVREFDK